MCQQIYSFFFSVWLKHKFPNRDKIIFIAVLSAFGIFKRLYLGSEFTGHSKIDSFYLDLLKNSNNCIVKLHNMRKPVLNACCIEIDMHMFLHFQYQICHLHFHSHSGTPSLLNCPYTFTQYALLPQNVLSHSSLEKNWFLLWKTA